MKHWTLELCDRYREEGFKYAIFDRRSYGDGFHQGINHLEEMYDFLNKAYPRFAEDEDLKIRIALTPQREEGVFLIMYYPSDGSFWVRGRIRTL